MVLMLRDGDDTRLFILSQERGEDRPLFASAAGGRQTAWTPLAFRMTAGRLRHRADSWSTRRSHPDEHVFGTWFWEYYLAGDLVSVDGLIAEVPGAVPLQADRRVPSLRVLLADVGKTDLAPRFRRAADHNGWEDADHGSLRATAGRDVGGRVGG